MIKGENKIMFICDGCARSAGIQPKRPADSLRESWNCKKCQHLNIGSMMMCEIGDWLIPHPISYINQEKQL